MQRWLMTAVLAACGASLDSVVKTTVFIKDMGEFAKMNEVYGRYFSANPPARSSCCWRRRSACALTHGAAKLSSLVRRCLAGSNGSGLRTSLFAKAIQSIFFASVDAMM